MTPHNSAKRGIATASFYRPRNPVSAKVVTSKGRGSTLPQTPQLESRSSHPTILVCTQAGVGTGGRVHIRSHKGLDKHRQLFPPLVRFSGPLPSTQGFEDTVTHQLSTPTPKLSLKEVSAGLTGWMLLARDSLAHSNLFSGGWGSQLHRDLHPSTIKPMLSCEEQSNLSTTCICSRKGKSGCGSKHHVAGSW